MAITRAQALLIVIGDPDILGENELWRTFLDYIKSRGGWTGKKPNWNSAPVVPPPEDGIVPNKRGVFCREEVIDEKSEHGSPTIPKLVAGLLGGTVNWRDLFRL